LSFLYHPANDVHSSTREQNILAFRRIYSAGVVVVLFLGGCNGLKPRPQPTATPTLTPIPTSTSTMTPTPTRTSTPTVTPVPEPETLSGTVYLSGEALKPFKSVIQLRQYKRFDIVATVKTDAAGKFTIENVQPGVYELWILLTARPKMISGCQEIDPPEDTWGIGITFEEGKAIKMDDRWSLGRALVFLENLPAGEFPVSGIYSVNTAFEVKAGGTNVIEVTLGCL
jgi:hypothetical protein